MNKVIIFGDDHHNTLGVVWSFAKVGIKPIVYIYDSVSHMVKYSRYISHCFCVKKDDIIQTLISSYSDEDFKPVLICTDDESISIIDRNYEKLKDFFLLSSVNHTENRINYYLDKNNMQTLAIECGLNCPKSYLVNAELLNKEDYPYPCIIKPISSLVGGKEEQKVVSCSKELSDVVKPNLQYQLQEYIEKDYEVLLPWLSLNHGNKIIKTGVVKKLRQYPWGKGCTSYSVFEDVSKFPNLDVSKIERFVKAIGYEGLFSIEFLFKNGKFYFLEINLRNDGVGYAPTKAGCNLPALWYSYITGIELATIKKCKFPMYSMIDEYDFIHVLKRKISLMEWFKDFRRTQCFFLFNIKDLKPFIMHWFFVISGAGLKI